MPTTTSLNFVSQLYQTMVLRQGTTSDLDFWANQLDAGSVTENQVASDFALATEAQQLVLPIARLYQTFFGRAPDAVGLQDWVSDFRGGASLASIAGQFVQSNEFQARYGVTPPPQTFLTALYADVLGRAPDPAGDEYWIGQLNAGGNSVATEATVAVGFSNSNEFIADSNFAIEQWLAAAGISGTYAGGTIAGLPSSGPGEPANFYVGANTTLTVDEARNLTSVNFAVAGGVTLTLGNGTAGSAGDFDTNPVTSVTVTGGNAASAFVVNDPTGVFGNSTFSNFDASGFAGSVQLVLANDVLIEGAGGKSLHGFIAGGGSANSLFVQADGVLAVGGIATRFQTVTIDTTGFEGGVVSVDPSRFTGLTTLNLDDIRANSDLRNPTNDLVSNLAPGVTVGIGDTFGNAFADRSLTIDLSGPVATGTADALTVDLNNEGLSSPGSSHWPNINYSLPLGQIPGESSGEFYPLDYLITNGVENFTFNAATTGNQSFNFGVQYTGLDSDPARFTFTGGQTGQFVELTHSGIPTNVTTVAAAGLSSDLVFDFDARLNGSDGQPPALIVTGGSGWNWIELANSGDSLNGGSSGHNTLIVDASSATGAVGVNLAATVGLNEITAFAGSASLPMVTNFQNVDLYHLSGGPNGGTVIASPGGSTIIGSSYADNFTLSATGTGTNTIVLSGNVYDAINVANPVGGITTFAQYTNVSNFDAAGRTDFLALNAVFAPPASGTIVTVAHDSLVDLNGNNAFFVTPNGAPVALTSETSVVAAIGKVQIGFGLDFIILDNGATAASSTEFGVYEVQAHEPVAAPLGFTGSDTIKLLGLFQAPGGFAAANYHGLFVP